ncbi:Uncharacterised protein [Vibrio cholerae]|nr:Uncharacterised protein [Vibrio cholerae]
MVRQNALLWAWGDSRFKSCVMSVSGWLILKSQNRLVV